MLIHKDKIAWLPQRYISIVMTSGDPRELVSQVHEIWNQYLRIPVSITFSSTNSSTTSIVRMRCLV